MMIRIGALMALCLAVFATAAVALPMGFNLKDADKSTPGAVDKSANTFPEEFLKLSRAHRFKTTGAEDQGHGSKTKRSTDGSHKIDERGSIITRVLSNLRQSRPDSHKGKVLSGKIWRKDWFDFKPSRRHNGGRWISWWARLCCKLFWSKKLCGDEDPASTTVLTPVQPTTGGFTGVGTKRATGEPATSKAAIEPTLEATSVSNTRAVRSTVGGTAESTTTNAVPLTTLAATIMPEQPNARTKATTTLRVTESPTTDETATPTSPLPEQPTTSLSRPYTNATEYTTTNELTSSSAEPNTALSGQPDTGGSTTSADVPTTTAESTSQKLTPRPTIGEPVIQ